MGQDEIYSILKKDKFKWFSTTELSKILNLNMSSINISVTKLYKFKEIIRKKRKKGNEYLYSIEGEI